MSSSELLLILLVALIVFGPKKLPMLATHLGLMLSKVTHLKQQVHQWWQQQLTLQENERKAQAADEHYKKASNDEQNNP